MPNDIVILEYNEILLDYNAYEETTTNYVIRYAVENTVTKVVTLRTITANSLNDVSSIKALLQNIMSKQKGI